MIIIDSIEEEIIFTKGEGNLITKEDNPIVLLIEENKEKLNDELDNYFERKGGDSFKEYLDNDLEQYKNNAKMNPNLEKEKLEIPPKLEEKKDEQVVEQKVEESKKEHENKVEEKENKQEMEVEEKKVEKKKKGRTKK